MGSGASTPKSSKTGNDNNQFPTSPQATNNQNKTANTNNKDSKKDTKKFNQCYKLEKDLGSGAFSIVKKGSSLLNGNQYAIKIVSKKKLTQEDLASLMLEIEILDSINHAHVIRLIETFDEGNDFYIVTELVEGGELFDRIVAKTHYTEKEARDLVKILIDTIAHIHDAGIVHRDLKPENLLLTSVDDDSNVKICDFGFAKRIKDLVQDETACGTPGYVAPEILRGDLYGAEVDIWSLGVICYVILAGYPPFYDEDQRKLFKKIKDGRYYFHDEYWSHVSADAMDLIRKMLCVDQKQRWTARKLLQHPWITAGDDVLNGKDLTKSITALKQYHYKKKFRAAANAVIMSNRINKLLDFRKAVNDLKQSEESDTNEVLSTKDPFSTKLTQVEEELPNFPPASPKPVNTVDTTTSTTTD